MPYIFLLIGRLACLKEHKFRNYFPYLSLLGCVAQLGSLCLAADTCMTADSEVTSSILAQYHSFVEIDHEINYLVKLDKKKWG